MSAPKIAPIQRAAIVALSSVVALVASCALLPFAASADSCPNAILRVGPSASLPDCRAFELVTPMVKGDNSTIGGADGNPYGFPDGNHVFYGSILPMPGAQSGSLESALSTRTSSGWVTTALAPAAGRGEPIEIVGNGSAGNLVNTTTQAAFTSDFSAAFLELQFAPDPLDQDGNSGDAYRMDISSGAWSLAAIPETGALTSALEPSRNVGGDGTYIVGISNNADHVLFASMDQIPVAPNTLGDPHPEYSDMLYDRTGGHTYAVGILPNGTVPTNCDVELGDGVKDAIAAGTLGYDAVSPDGSNVVFRTQGSGFGIKPCPEPGIYLRERNTTTVQLQGQSYAGRSADGSKVFTEGGSFEKPTGIYEYDTATGATTTISPEGSLVASSADGSRVYYWIEAGPKADLYLWEDGATKLIPKAGEGFASGARNEPVNGVYNAAVATPDGTKLLFLDTADLTGYNNFGPTCNRKRVESGTPGFCAEAYIYDATTGVVTCVSCNPTGAPPQGPTGLMNAPQIDTLLPPYSAGQISSDGSIVFFETLDPLVPQDTNGLRDVYEWKDGRVYLISSGQGTYGSIFSGASSDGRDVFITTTDHLAPQDIENSGQIYDARVDGGFAYTPFSSGCDSGQCQGPQTPAPSFGPPASATFVGLGNPTPANTPVVVARRKAKVVKRPKSKKKQRAGKRKRRK
jgi:hypothetical protein